MEIGGRESKKIESPITVLDETPQTAFSPNILKNSQTNFEKKILFVQSTRIMARILKKCKDFGLYLTSQFPGFMLIFYLCYLYTGWLVFVFFTSLSLAGYNNCFMY